jgi:hypothetical protein
MLPDRLYIDENDRELYENCKEGGIFLKSHNNKDKFMFSMSIGFKNNFKRELKKKEGFFYIKDLKSEDEALINSIAILKKNIDVMPDKKTIYELVEEYARGGIKILSDQIDSGVYGSFWKLYEKEVHDLLNGLPPELNGTPENL